MKKYRIAAVLLTALMAFSAAGCSNNKTKSNPTSESSTIANLQDPLASNSIQASLSQETEKNETMYTLNRVVDSGKRSENNERFIYLDITIRNNSSTDYELSTLNNFYLLLDDGNEIHFDVRTQLYAQSNIDGYVTNPFTVAAGAEISGITGGFLLSDNVTSFQVCFFPTGASGDDKSSVVKVPVTAADIVTL